LLFKLSSLTAQVGRPLRSWAAARAAVKTRDTMEAFIVADGGVQIISWRGSLFKMSNKAGRIAIGRRRGKKKERRRVLACQKKQDVECRLLRVG
jgi:hypothetical protein